MRAGGTMRSRSDERDRSGGGHQVAAATPAHPAAGSTPVLALQRAIGNQAVRRALSGVQGAPDAGAVPPVVNQVLRSAGEPLDAQARAYMEPVFGEDFGGVRVHTDARAAGSAGAVGARAYTVGSHVVFASGQYAPGTGGGRHLLAHELAHVVQQRRSASCALQAAGAAPGEGAAEREADRAADTAVRGGRTGRISATPVRLARKGAGYVTAELRARAGWTFVAYVDQGYARLGYRVTDGNPNQRIGNIGWVTHNPGSLDLTTPTVPDPANPGKRVPAPPGSRIAAKHGAYEKDPADIATYRRFAVFPTQQAGEGAVYPMLEVLARSNGNPTVDGLLRIYLRGPQPAGDDTLGAYYVQEIRSVLRPRFERRQAAVHADKPEKERKANAESLTEGLMGRRFLDIHPGSWEAQFLLEAVLKVESTRDMARIGLEYACSGGFRNVEEARGKYAAAPAKLREITAVVTSPEVKKQLESVLRCEEARTA